MALVIHKSDIDGQSGMLRLKLQAESPHAIHGHVCFGPVEHVAIFPQALANFIGPDDSPAQVREAIQRWLEPRHREMLVRKRMIEVAAEATAKLSGGARVEFPGEQDAH